MNHIFEAGFAVLRIEITYDLHQSVLGVWVCVCVGGGGAGSVRIVLRCRELESRL